MYLDVGHVLAEESVDHETLSEIRTPRQADRERRIDIARLPLFLGFPWGRRGVISGLLARLLDLRLPHLAQHDVLGDMNLVIGDPDDRRAVRRREPALLRLGFRALLAPIHDDRFAVVGPDVGSGLIHREPLRFGIVLPQPLDLGVGGFRLQPGELRLVGEPPLVALLEKLAVVLLDLEGSRRNRDRLALELAATVVGVHQRPVVIHEAFLQLLRGGGHDARYLDLQLALRQLLLQVGMEVARDGDPLRDEPVGLADGATDGGGIPLLRVDRVQEREGLGFLERLDIGALQVLDDAQRPRIAVVVALAHDAERLGGLVEGQRAEPPLAGDDLEALADRPDDDRLQQALLGDRGGQLGQRLRVEGLAGVVRRRVDIGERDEAHADRDHLIVEPNGVRRRRRHRCGIAAEQPLDGRAHGGSEAHGRLHVERQFLAGVDLAEIAPVDTGAAGQLGDRNVRMGGEPGDDRLLQRRLECVGHGILSVFRSGVMGMEEAARLRRVRFAGEGEKMMRGLSGLRSAAGPVGRERRLRRRYGRGSLQRQAGDRPFDLGEVPADAAQLMRPGGRGERRARAVVADIGGDRAAVGQARHQLDVAAGQGEARPGHSDSTSRARPRIPARAIQVCGGQPERRSPAGAMEVAVTGLG